MEDLHEKGKLDETRRIFQVLESLFVEDDQETRDLIGLGFFETLQNVASRRPQGNKAYEQFLGPMSRKVGANFKKCGQASPALWMSSAQNKKTNNPGYVQENSVAGEARTGPKLHRFSQLLLRPSLEETVKAQKRGNPEAKYSDNRPVVPSK